MNALNNAMLPATVPLDMSDDNAHDLVNNFFADPDVFARLSEDVADSEFLMRAEVTGRLLVKLNECVEAQWGRNQHLGLDKDDVKTRFIKAAQNRAQEQTPDVPLAAYQAVTDYLQASSSTAIALFEFLHGDGATKLERLRALAGMVASMEVALDLTS